MSITDLTRTDVLTAAPTTTVGDVTAAMREHDADLVVVLDEDRPRGLVTAADVGRAFGAGDDLASATVTDLLAAESLTVPETLTRADLLAEFRDTGGRRAVVVDDDGAFVGVVTFEDLLAAYGRELSTVFELL